MWTPLITLYALALLMLIVVAGGVATFTRDRHQAARAAMVLRLLLAAALGSTGLAAVMIRLHYAGLL